MLHSITNLCTSLHSRFIVNIFNVDQEFPSIFYPVSDILFYLSPIIVIVQCSAAAKPGAKEHIAGNLIALKSETFDKEW